MFRLAVESLHVSANYEPGEGWRLIVRCRRGDESWETVVPTVFDRLSTPEMASTVETWFAHELGL